MQPGEGSEETAGKQKIQKSPGKLQRVRAKTDPGYNEVRNHTKGYRLLGVLIKSTPDCGTENRKQASQEASGKTWYDRRKENYMEEQFLDLLQMMGVYHYSCKDSSEEDQWCQKRFLLFFLFAVQIMKVLFLF